MSNQKFVVQGSENGKKSYRFMRKRNGQWATVATIFFDGSDWVVFNCTSERVDRFGRLSEAKDECLKI